MLLRTVVVLLLCASSGLCATLGHYQTEERVVEDPVDSNLSDSAETPDGATTTETRPPAPEPKLLVEETAATEADVNIPGPGGAPADGGVKLPGEALVQLEPSEEEASEMTPLQTKQSMNDSVPLEDNGWSISSIRNSFQKIHGYVDSLVELVGGRDGVCEYRCRHGECLLEQTLKVSGCSEQPESFTTNFSESSCDSTSPLRMFHLICELIRSRPGLMMSVWLLRRTS